MICQYCGKHAKAVTGAVIYPHRRDLASLKFYQCSPCDAFVGCHKLSGRPLGTLANSELREWRKRAHAAFDPLWRDHVFSSRANAYAWIAEKMKLTKKDTHIAMFDAAKCEELIKQVSDYKQGNI